MISRFFADISNNNTGFNAREYADAGHRLIGIKASEGLSFVDPDHATWTLHAHLNHIGVLHYHFARPDEGHNPQDEAAFFLRCALPHAGGRDYLILDMERNVPSGFQHDPAWTRGFAEHVHAHSRFTVVLYANRSTLEQSDQWLSEGKRRVWEADFSDHPDFAPPGYQLFARQFTDGVFGPEPHSLPGVGRADIDRMGHALFAAVVARSTSPVHNPPPRHDPPYQQRMS